MCFSNSHLTLADGRFANKQERALYQTLHFGIIPNQITNYALEHNGKRLVAAIKVSEFLMTLHLDGKIRNTQVMHTLSYQHQPYTIMAHCIAHDHPPIPLPWV